MDKQEIKKLLREQVEPMEQAVERKLEYLKSDDVFTEEQETPQLNDNSLLNAFMEVNPQPQVPVYQQPTARELYQSENLSQPKYVEAEPTQQSIDEHKQNIAAKIAALRGISMPGDYLRNKK